MRLQSRLFVFVSLFVMSYQLIGGMSASVADRTRSHLVMLIAEDEYRANESLPVFAAKYLARDFQVTAGLTPLVIPQRWSLYQTSPLADGAEILTTGTIEGLPSEPVSWTYIRSVGGPSFYSSMGHVDDFKNQRFNQLLYHAMCCAVEIEPAASEVSSSDTLWKARFVTPVNAFTPGIEGPACDAAGNILVVNFEKQGTIGRVNPDGSADVYVTLPEGSTGNGIRFDAAGNFFVADYTGHNVLKVNSETRNVSTLAHNDEMNQPNDLAIAPDGTLYASDPAWDTSTGQLWRIDMDGTTTRLAKDMGTTNGIEVSPDGTTLYVNESVQRNIWAFDLTSEKRLTNKRLIRKFPDHGFDGMRCDVDGNLYIARYGAGTVVKMSPAGKILQTVAVLGARPSNVCFGGPDGCTLYVTQVDDARLVSFRVDRPGRVWGERQSAN